MTGRCRFCGCTMFTPCPEGCGWADRQHTVCTSCVDVNRAWGRRVTRPPTMTRAFARGFSAAEWETEIRSAVNPYRPGRTARYWQHGFDATYPHPHEAPA